MKTFDLRPSTRPILVATMAAAFLMGCGESEAPSGKPQPSLSCAQDEECVDGTCEDGECVPYACVKDEDCPNGTCEDYACVPHECMLDDDCQDGTCEEHVCVPHACILDNDCQNGTCEENLCVPHECIVDDDCLDGTCKENVCVPHECVVDGDCLDGTCEENICVPHECVLDGDCLNGTCENNVCVPHACIVDGDCQDGTCEENFCVPHECVLDGDCLNGTCEDNVCVPHECIVDGDCLNGTCEENVCVPHECIVDGDCPNGACEDNVCVPHECIVDGDCLDATCEENVCVPHECIVDGDCLNGTCEEYVCVPHECIVDGDCLNGTCEENICVPHQCIVDGDCTDGTCKENVCVPHECIVDGDCTDGTCEENVCVPHECLINDHCVDGTCEEYACVPYECIVDGDCTDGTCDENVCVPHECLHNDHCVDGTCEEYACVPYECTGDHHCQDGTCVENACMPHECMTDDACVAGTCEANTCVPYECVSDLNCRAGICVNNTCVDGCRSDKDCLSGVCEENVCTARECRGDADCDDGTCEKGRCRPLQCTTHSDCKVGVCEDNVCVAGCANDNDCPNADLCFHYSCVTPGPCVLGVHITSVQEGFDNPACTEIRIPKGDFVLPTVKAHRDMTVSGVGSDNSRFNGNSKLRHFVITDGITLRLEGLTLYNGRGDRGGSILGGEGASLELDDVIFQNNFASQEGGAVHLSGAITGTDCKFIDNRVTRGQVAGGSPPAAGGAIFSDNGAISLQHCLFKQNSAWSDAPSGSGIPVYGGAIYATAPREQLPLQTMTLTHSTFESNSVSTMGLIPSLRSGGAIHAESYDVSMTNMLFFGNQVPVSHGCTVCGGGRGGAISLTDGKFKIKDFAITNSTVALRRQEGLNATGELLGGAVYLYNVLEIDIEGGEFRNNKILNGRQGRGGAIYLHSDLESDSSFAPRFTSVGFHDNEVRCTHSTCSSGATTDRYDRAQGGALALQVPNGTVRPTFSRVVGASNVANAPRPASGGGFMSINVGPTGTVNSTLTNVTFVDNETNGRQDDSFTNNGGGNHLLVKARGDASTSEYGAVSMQFRNATIISNLDVPFGVGFAVESERNDAGPAIAALVSLRNSIFWSKEDRLCRRAGNVSFRSEGWLVRPRLNSPSAAGCGLNQADGDVGVHESVDSIGVEPLSYNGGVVESMALTPHNVVRTTGEPGGCTNGGGNAIVTDSRNFPRTTPNCTPGSWSE